MQSLAIERENYKVDYSVKQVKDLSHINKNENQIFLGLIKTSEGLPIKKGLLA